MSNATRPDFAQKLLSDLKMRKERMVATQGSGRGSGNMSAGVQRESRRSHKGSTEMKSLAKVTSNTTKMQRASNGSQSTRMNSESSSMIVPYGGGHGSRQPVDLSMTLSYALDDNGKLKKMNLTGSNAVIGFLRQISRRRMDFANADGGSASSRIQWPSSAQFPTLTHLRIDEVSKGAQRLNQILKSFYNGVNSSECSVDIGKELLKGTMELEESLRMLVSLQEASEYMAAPQRKSRVKLLEMGEDEDNDDGKGDKAVKKRVERPVFSFDKRAKNEKAVMAITYPKEASDQGKPQKKPNAHRRSASLASSVSNDKPEGARISNVVAKLMGLEEIPRNGGESNKAGSQLTRYNNALDHVVSQRMTFGVSRSEFGDEDAWSIGSRSAIQDRATGNKIVILTSKKMEGDERKPAWSQREREQIMTHMMQLNRKENGGVKKALSKDEAQRAANPVLKKNGHEKRSVSKVPERRVGQEKSVRDGRLQHPKSPLRVETQGKSQRLEPKNGKKGLSKAPARKTEAVIEISTPKDIHEVKDEKGHREMVLQEVTFESSTSTKEEILSNLKPKQEQEVTKSHANESNSLNMEADKQQSAAVTQKVAHKMANTKSGPNQKANEVMTKLAKSASRPSKAMKQQATILQGLERRQPVNKGPQQPNSSVSRPIESHAVRSKNAGTKPGSDSSEQHMEIHKATDKASSYTGDDLRFCEDLENIPQILSNQDVNLKLPYDQLDQPLMQGKDAESKPQTNEFVQASDNREVPYRLHQEKAAYSNIQQPLTDDEIYLKQTLITSQVFLNTAEALFKLDIPIGILNAGDILCQEEKEAKQVTDCAYEMLKMKGKRRELVFYPCKNAQLSNIKMTSLDDLVRQLHKDFESLRSYGKTFNSEFDQVEYLLKMMERDIHHKDMDVNCMWDMGWNETVFAYIEMDEVIRDVEKCMLNELLDDVLEGFMEVSPHITHRENIRKGVAAC